MYTTFDQYILYDENVVIYLFIRFCFLILCLKHNKFKCSRQDNDIYNILFIIIINDYKFIYFFILLSKLK